MSPSELGEQAELGEAVSAKIIAGAKKLANIGGFISGVALLDKRSKVMKLTSSTSALDELLGGGFETQSIVEVYGEFGSGKTQVGHQLAVNCILPVEQGGYGGRFSISIPKTHSGQKESPKWPRGWGWTHPKS